ncbi:hypothetical protein M9H77_13487 [Catharanthus roseus]|uniref:Uncharacterized protein n=1 Tax=Catharanthus roseus TaxID=4058 RepID=A0ACC0BKK1_CATRO|nr:hypothetical protein M9H77_13487 [Catharanthus roseus]
MGEEIQSMKDNDVRPSKVSGQEERRFRVFMCQFRVSIEPPGDWNCTLATAERPNQSKLEQKTTRLTFLSASLSKLELRAFFLSPKAKQEEPTQPGMRALPQVRAHE